MTENLEPNGPDSPPASPADAAARATRKMMQAADYTVRATIVLNYINKT